MKINASLIDKITEDLIKHEGIIFSIYLDTEGLHTVGVGHLIKLGDEEFKKPVGTEVSKERVLELLKQDLAIAIRDVEDVFPAVNTYPDDVQRVLVNMMFNLGRPRFMKFQNMIGAVRNGDWNKAADEMVDSKWYRQVKGRAKELEELMRNA